MGVHDPARFTTYVSTHEGWMSSLRRKGFIQDGDSLRFHGGEYSSFIELCGQIPCLGGIVITVEKYLRVLPGDGEQVVQTWRYNYNASVQDHGNIMRYDNADHHGFPDPHHRHDYDWRTGRELNASPVHVGEAQWPTLGAFVETVHTWYIANYTALLNPQTPARISHPYIRRTGAGL